MYAQDSRARPPPVVEDASSRIYFGQPGGSGITGGGGSYLFNFFYNIIANIFQVIFALFRTNVRPGILKERNKR